MLVQGSEAMKKVTAILLTGVLFCSFVGCNSNECLNHNFLTQSNMLFVQFVKS